MGERRPAFAPRAVPNEPEWALDACGASFCSHAAVPRSSDDSNSFVGAENSFPISLVIEAVLAPTH